MKVEALLECARFLSNSILTSSVQWRVIVVGKTLHCDCGYICTICFYMQTNSCFITSVICLYNALCWPLGVVEHTSFSGNRAMSQWDVNSWLQEIDYDKRYAQAFIDNGYVLPNLCANLKDEDLDAIEVDKEDRNRLFEHVERLRHWSFARIPISYDSPVHKKDVPQSSVNCNGDVVGNRRSSSSTMTNLSLDQCGASHEPSVKSPDSLGSVSHELPDHMPPSSVQLYSEALNQPSTQVPKKPPRSSKKQEKVVQMPPPASTSGGSLSRLQLKLKIKQELQKDHILITEPPYVQVSK